MENHEMWQWIWLGMFVMLSVAEMATVGGFIFAPFSVGAAVAAGAMFAGASVAAGWVLFLVVSVAFFAALRPLARRLNANTSDGVGALRLIGETATVLEPVDHLSSGLVRTGGETWRATAATSGAKFAAGEQVSITDMEGTRLIVQAVPSPTEPVEVHQ